MAPEDIHDFFFLTSHIPPRRLRSTHLIRPGSSRMNHSSSGVRTRRANGKIQKDS